MSQVTFLGNPVSISGKFLQVGESAPDFILTDKTLTDVSLSSFVGKRKILNIFPSIDTDVCATSVRHFNQRAAQLDNTVVLCISADLPFAQARFCGAEGLDNVITLSTMRNADFKFNYGVDISEGALKGLCARAVIILDEENKVVYTQLVAEIATEPDYEAAIKAAS